VKSLTQNITDHLRAEIITGKIEPGQKLDETKLSQRLGASRPPLREAFRILEKERLVYNVSRKGTFVTKISEENYRDISTARELLECNSLDILKTKKNCDLSKIEKALDNASHVNMPDEYDIDKILECHEVIENFHFQLISATENSWIIHFYNSFFACLSRYQFVCLKKRGVIKNSIKEHRNIFDFIKANDFKSAKRLLNCHIMTRKC
jgi:DNA-binding GntR family transcriptional regulator